MLFAALFGSDTRPPVLLKFRSSETFIIFTVASAVFTDVFIYGIIVPVLPFALSGRVAIGADDIQKWISIFLAVYGAALLVAAPFCGWFADRLRSRRWPLLFGLVALAGSTIMLCVGNSIGVLAAGRVLQGISAAVVWVVGLALLVDTVGPDNIGSAMGYVSLSMSLSYLFAPLLGGVVFEKAGYYAVWAMAYGLIVLDIIMRVFLIEKKMAKKWLGDENVPSPDATNEKKVAGIEEDDGEVVAVSPVKTMDDNVAPTIGHAQDRDDANPVAGDRNGCLTPSTAAEVAAERMSTKTPTVFWRVAQNLPPVFFLLGSRRLLSALVACVMQATLLTSFDALLPLFVNRVFHWDSIGAGLLFISLVVPSFVGPVIGILTDKYGPRWFATIGFLICAPFYILLRLVHKDTLDQKVLLCSLLALAGFGLMLALTPMLAEVAYAVDAKAKRRPPGYFGQHGAYAQAFSLFNMAWAAGCFLGPILGGLVNESDGWEAATLMLGCISAASAIPTLIWTGGSIFKKRKAEKLRRQGHIEEGGE